MPVHSDLQSGTEQEADDERSLESEESARHKRQRKDVADRGSKRGRMDDSEEECLPWFDPALVVQVDIVK